MLGRGASSGEEGIPLQPRRFRFPAGDISDMEGGNNAPSGFDDSPLRPRNDRRPASLLGAATAVGGRYGSYQSLPSTGDAARDGSAVRKSPRGSGGARRSRSPFQMRSRKAPTREAPLDARHGMLYRKSRRRIRKYLRKAAAAKGRVAAYCTCESIDVEALLSCIQPPSRAGGRSRSAMSLDGRGEWDAQLFMDALHLRPRGGGAADIAAQRRALVREEERSGMPPIFGAGTDAEARAPAGSASRAAAAGDAFARQPAGTQPGAATAGEEAAREQLDFEQRLVGARDVFVFDYGCVVFWGTRSAEEEEILERIRVGHNGTLFQTANVEEIENDDMEFMYGLVSQMQRDEVCLRTTGPDEKLAVSFAFSQSVMLSVFEGRVEDAIRSTEHYPQLMAETGDPQIEESEVARQIGRLFILRSAVNLESGILDRPDYFWEDDTYQDLYLRGKEYLECNRRLGVLNTRLDVVKDMLELLQTSVSNQHANRLEMIIIVLIVVEVLVMVLWNIVIKDVLGYFPDRVHVAYHAGSL
jgi:uncharacterized Rmd1/YagE family protein